MKVKVCTWVSCKSRFSEYIVERLENDVKFSDLKNLKVEKCPCLWNCSKWPSILIDWKLEDRMNPWKASDLVNKKIKNTPKKK